MIKITEEDTYTGIKAPFELNKPENAEEARAWIVEQEAIGNRPPTTRKGTIESLIGEGDDRIAIINYLGIYVYIFNDSLTKNLKNSSDETLKGKAIKFKLAGKYNDKYIGSCTDIVDYYKLALAHGNIMTGKLIEIKPSKNRKYEKEATILSKGDLVYVEAGDLALPQYVSPENCINKNLDFVVREVKENGKVYVSTLIPYEYRKQQLDYFYDIGKSFKATVSEVKNFGAFLLYKNNVTLVLRNKDFSSNYTACKKVLEPGDIVDVKIKEITPDEHKYVIELVEKFEAKQTTKVDEIKKDEEYTGEVVTVEPFGCFVNISPGIDVLCPISRDKREPVEGDNVKIKITATHSNENKVRGTIIKYNDNLPDLSAYNLI